MIVKLKTLGAIARAACGCLLCTGLADNAPPSSCLAPAFLESFLWLEDDEVTELIKAWEAS